MSELTNDVGYQTESGVTSIVGGIVTTDYINALDISVNAANITGTLNASDINITGAFIAQKDGKFGIIKKDGTTVIEFTYENISYIEMSRKEYVLISPSYMKNYIFLIFYS